ncbi:polysaccharide deacetylase family protein [Ponticoccus sp. SC2-23]|uniref:polysaccharide deacetylase family protein n=1 Tax=Alexandriicola marinus TaxID=2081710 RepID=UPI000FD9F2A8|nr:polysaccharide deacetylase family protein [Ponticoccus sp. SC6-9]MBM1227014.1 polysaccharide deacetylase family protein [Ponticoccus sp. SC6-15]MBM1231435.1 polysaccharide deacetylase family protein [Ponticoccus sp. SC6-38]MBM1236008.1 polysaccharide deacetylase family protein [Ponticoccus sp. SC6-45]MBM1240458.1 polysaccharide deacetylase family protein [Ponticoccus sp. SC6-49]MBM1244993.1 polysaccharide deacetylase family protein [Ponticoccus sp. SC2-64]MBM1249482.1 polysaccharide deacet
MRRVILNFHGIGTPGRPLEPGEAEYWVAPELLGETLALAERLSDHVTLDLTFDDGNDSDLELAAPILSRFRKKAHFFVLANRIDAPGSLSTQALRELVARGHEIGSHGAGHVDWSACSLESLQNEVGPETRDRISASAGVPVRAAAIPFGRYNRRVLKALRLAGYQLVYSSDGGAWRPGQYPIPRTSPRSDMDMQDIEAILLGREPIRRKLRRYVSRAMRARM